MNRNGALVALGIAAVTGLVFGLYPDLDLKITALFFDSSPQERWLGATAWEWPIRNGARWVITAIAASAFVAVAAKLLFPRQPLWLPGRAAVLMIATLALGPGLLTNTILKDHWGRPRPLEVTAFDGEDRLDFKAWWDPRGACPKNCSFVAGEPSGAFWTLAPAVLLPPPWRAVATAAALVFGAGLGALRIAAGGHFFSDVVFAGVFTFLLIWLFHGLLYRWRPTRISDQAVERALEMIAAPFHRFFTWIAERIVRGAGTSNPPP
jgi:membrane-associated phospholipid phosphatase